VDNKEDAIAERSRVDAFDIDKIPPRSHSCGGVMLI